MFIAKSKLFKHDSITNEEIMDNSIYDIFSKGRNFAASFRGGGVLTATRKELNVHHFLLMCLRI